MWIIALALVAHMAGSKNDALELWGGVECTINRVGDRYFSQMERSGHLDRESDLERFAALGFRVIRYPVLWEHVSPDGVHFDWTWTDNRLAKLRDLGMHPIVGLTHHGSGPPTTSLVDPAFAIKLGEYAARVADRYPWVTDFTPINEPLTTARFSGLYGHWYPHGESLDMFARCLVNQCTAVAVAMERIREIIPEAKLVQTEDIGHVYSTPALAYQAEFENERRWLSYDLLCGRVDRHYALRKTVLEWGVREKSLDRFLEQPCAPDLFGVNHYLTSDRYLDEDLSKYPEWSRGGNGKDTYADVDAALARNDCPVDTAIAARETWERYHLPIAVTEVQLSSTRDEQMRWLYEIWCGAKRIRDEGVDIRAVTLWSLLGAYDWNHLVTRVDGFYESGAFDMRAPSPRPTAIARLARVLARNEKPDEPALEGPGFWRRKDRAMRPLAEGRTTTQKPDVPAISAAEKPSRKIAVMGAAGTLGRAFTKLCDVRGLPYHAAARNDVDIGDPHQVERWLAERDIWAVVNAAGYVRVDDAEDDELACMHVNAKGVDVLAKACAHRRIPLVTFSSDLVFDGRKHAPFVESDLTRPRNVYGRSKVAAELAALDACPDALVIRSSALFGPWDESNFVTKALDAFRRGEKVRVAHQIISPTYVVDLVHSALDLLLDRERGIWHLANRGEVTWAKLARMASDVAGIAAARIEETTESAAGWRAPRPRFSALASERGWVMPTLEDALTRYVRERGPRCSIRNVKPAA